MRTDFNTLNIIESDNIVQIVLNRPDQRNAITHEMQREIDEALDAAELDDDVLAVVLRGEGKVFSAGHDLNDQKEKSFPELTFPWAKPSIPPGMPRAWYFRKPLISVVHNFVGPYAVALVACCDFNIATEDVRFDTAIFRGHYPDIPWTPLYLQLPMRVIEKMFLFGGWLDAEVALQHQFVQRVLPTVDEAVVEGLRWAQQATLLPPGSFQYSKDKIRRSVELLGLSSLPSVLDPYGPPHAPGKFDFGALVAEHGLTEAIKMRREIIDQDVARV